MIKKFKTPILFLVFNRPDTTELVWQEIKKQKPTKLFIAADGPRKGNQKDKQRCKQVKEVVKQIDWECEVKRLYRKKNLGCKTAISSAINWFFDNVKKGIILEDDCLPDPSFFKFTEALLKKYKNNKKILHISGNNFHPHSKDKNDYYFSKYPHIWGWGTWRRAWKKYKVEINSWPKFKKSNHFKKYFSNYSEKIYWHGIFDLVYQNKIDTWDYQWLYCCWQHDGLSITPKYNLVRNIGFGKQATHTKNDESVVANFPTNSIRTPFSHPKHCNFNKSYDLETSTILYGIGGLKNILYYFYFQIKTFIKNI